MSARERKAPFLVSAHGFEPSTGKFAMSQGLYFARSQAEALGQIINEYRGRFPKRDGFAEPIANACELTNETCAEIAKNHAQRSGRRK